MRRWLSLSLKIIGALLAIVLLAVMAGFAWLSSDGGRDFVLRTATGAARDSGLSVALNGVEGGLLGALTIGQVTIDDGDGRWLEARNLKLVWRPWQLLRGRLQVAELSADAIDVQRAPNLPPGEADTSGAAGMPSLPLRIELDRLAVARIDLGEALFGQAAALRLDAHARAARNAGDLGLRVDRLDAPGSVALDARFDVPEDALALELHLDEPGGGLLSELAGLEGKPPIRVALTGGGPLSQWRGRLQATIDNADWAVLQAAVDGRRTRTVTFDGQIGTQPFAGLLPEGLAPVIGPQIVLIGKAVFESQRVRMETLDIDSAGATLSVSGAYDLDAGDWNGTASLWRLSPNLARHFGIAVYQPVVTLEGRFARGRMAATLRLAAGYLETRGVAIEGLRATIEATQAFDAAPWNIAVTGDGQVAALPGEPSPASDKLLGPLTLAGHARLEPSGAAALDDLRFTLGPATLLASGRYGADGLADGNLSLDIADLTAFIPGATATEPMAARLATTMSYGDAKGLALSDLTLDLPGGRIAGQVGIDAGFERIEASLKSDGLDLGAISGLIGAPVAGRLALTSSLTGALDDPAVMLRANVQNGAYDGTAMPPAELRADIKTAVSAPQGDVALTVRPPQGATTLSAQVAMPNGDTLDLRAIRIEGPGVRGDGQIRLALDRALATGQVKLDAANLAPLLASAGLGGGGKANLRVSLSAANNTQQADVTASVASLTVSQAGAELVRIGRADLSAKGAVAGKNPITAKLSADSIAAGGAEIRRVTLDARGTADQLTFNLRTSAPAYQDLGLALDGTMRTERDVRTIRLTRGSGSLRKEAFTIQPGMTAVIATEAYQLRGFRISGRNLGEASVDGSLKKGAIDAKLTARGVPLALLGESADERKILGEVDVTASAAGTLERPRGQANLVARNVALAGDRGERKASATADITVDNRVATLQLTVSNLSDQPLIANASVTRGPKGLGFDDNSGLSGRVAWRGAVGDITRFSPLVGQEITGNLTTDLTLSGTLGKPGVAGTVAVDKGVVEDYATGLVLRFPHLEIVGDTRRLELRPFEALDPSGGKITGRAGMDLDATAGFPFSAQLDFTQARLLNRDDIMAILSGTVMADGSLQKAMVRGTLQSDRVEVNIDTGLPPSVVTLEVEEIPADGNGGEPARQATVQSKSEDAGGGAAAQFLLDIKLTMPGRVFVRGRGLDSEWESAVAVAGSAASPQVTGQLTSRRGQFDIIDKLFRLQASTIDLAPKADGSVDVLLNIKAVNDSNDLTVTVTLSGTASSPSIELSSSPAMPQDEILAQLLFGKNRASLTPFEALQLAQALHSLTSGGGGGLNVMATLRRTLGVDVLRVDSGSGTDAKPALEAGKYITEQVYVGVKQGVAQGSSAVTVDVDVLKNMSVGTEIRQDGTNRVGVKYKWDY